MRAGVHGDRDEGLREFGPVVSLDLPVFDYGQGRVALARAEMRQLEHQYSARAVRIRAAVRTARNDLLIATRRVKHYQDVLPPLRAQIVEQTQRQYHSMDLGVFQLIVARRAQVRTAHEYLIALSAYSQPRSTLVSPLHRLLVA